MHTVDYKDNPYYQESYQPDCDLPIYMGPLNLLYPPGCTVKFDENQVTYEGTLFKHGHQIFHPELKRERWCPTINEAFWAGAIDSRRPFILINNINKYKMTTFNKETGGINGTQRELFWLYHNGYTFKRLNQRCSHILCRPPAEINETPYIHENHELTLEMVTQAIAAIAQKIKDSTPKKRQNKHRRFFQPKASSLPIANSPVYDSLSQ